MKTSALYVLFCVIGVCIGLVSGVARAGLSEGLMAYYPFDGNANDVSGNGNNGTVFGAQLTEDRFGRANHAYLFDGIDDSVNTSSWGLLNTDDYTISAWIKRDAELSSNDLRSIAELNFPGSSYVSLNYRSTSGIQSLEYAHGWGDLILYDVSLGTSDWNHVAIQKNGSTTLLYLNGFHVESGTTGTAGGNGSATCIIGGSNYWDGKIDDVRIYDRALSAGEVQILAARDPQQPQRPDPTPPPVSSKSNLVLYTHGWNTSESGFTDSDGSWGKLDTALKAAVGSDWEVRGHDWTPRNDTISPWSALSNGMEEGRRVASQITNEGYDKVHLIAHSAGSGLVATAAAYIKTISPDTDVHITFLDPFVGFGWDEELYGAAADWADNYFSIDPIPLTAGPLSKAHNVDVTWLHPGAAPSHIWPVDWYTETINGTAPPGSNGYGFPLSQEGQGLGDPSAYPVGNDPVVLGGGSSQYENEFLVRHDTTLNMTTQTYVNSDTGTLSITGTGLSMLTGSPVWMTTLVETDDIVNFLTFEADFTSDPGAEGLLAVYWDNELLGLIDERYVLDGMQEYTMFLPGNFESGAYALSFRLDPYTDIDSSVLIDNVATGFVTPEPATLTLLALGGLVVLRRRRKQ